MPEVLELKGLLTKQKMGQCKIDPAFSGSCRESYLAGNRQKGTGKVYIVSFGTGKVRTYMDVQAFPIRCVRTIPRDDVFGAEAGRIDPTDTDVVRGCFCGIGIGHDIATLKALFKSHSNKRASKVSWNKSKPKTIQLHDGSKVEVQVPQMRSKREIEQGHYPDSPYVDWVVDVGAEFASLSDLAKKKFTIGSRKVQLVTKDSTIIRVSLSLKLPEGVSSSDFRRLMEEKLGEPKSQVGRNYYGKKKYRKYVSGDVAIKVLGDVGSEARIDAWSISEHSEMEASGKVIAAQTKKNYIQEKARMEERIKQIEYEDKKAKEKKQKGLL